MRYYLLATDYDGTLAEGGRVAPETAVALRDLLASGRRLIEPFLGAGAIFLGADFREALLNDANDDLMALWIAIRERPQEVIGAARALFDEEYRSATSYRILRARFNESLDRFERAVLFLYLNRFGFNGLCRYNGHGAFNVPYGRPRRLPNLPVDEITAAARKLECARLMVGGFGACMQEAGPGDVVYCDPPYLPAENGVGFAAYTGKRFGVPEHQQLVDQAWAAARRGARVLISNHDTAQTRELYRGFAIASLAARRSIAANAAQRGPVGELVAMLG